MKIMLFLAREIQYFELGIFSFDSYVYYLTYGFITSTRGFNLPTHAFSLRTRAFNLATCALSVLSREFELVARRFEPVTGEFELITREFELVTRGFELVTRRFELVTRNSCFTFPLPAVTNQLYIFFYISSNCISKINQILSNVLKVATLQGIDVL